VVTCYEFLNGQLIPDWVCRYLRDRLLPSAAGQDNPYGERIYISRDDAPTRKLLNENEVLDSLAQRGFRKVTLAGMGIGQQQRIFQDTRFIVAPHGGGLTNLVFCKPGTAVVEMFPLAVNDTYFRLCIEMGIDYYYVLTRKRDVPGLHVYYTIDIGELNDTIALAEHNQGRAAGG
jgi:capsular polysaccharide biosynthesis protein